MAQASAGSKAPPGCCLNTGLAHQPVVILVLFSSCAIHKNSPFLKGEFVCFNNLGGCLVLSFCGGLVFYVAPVTPARAFDMVTSSASLAATSAIGSSAVLRPLREPSRGLTSRRASYVVSCTMGTSRSRARSAESSLSAMPSALEAAQQRRGHQHDPDPRVRQALVDGAEQRHAEANVLLAEPDLDTA